VSVGAASKHLGFGRFKANMNAKIATKSIAAA
jgi:hypothetical protein